MHDFYKNIDEYNPNKENKRLIFFDNMIADMIHNKKINSIVTELSYFKVPKDVRLNTSHFLWQKSRIKENFNKLQ